MIPCSQKAVPGFDRMQQSEIEWAQSKKYHIIPEQGIRDSLIAAVNLLMTSWPDTIANRSYWAQQEHCEVCWEIS